MTSLHSPTGDELIAAHVDLTTPLHGVEVTISSNKSVLWVNVDGICILRICQIPYLLINES